MQSKKQICRFYQRGTCQYGARCKFAHEIEQQPKTSNNAFGFGQPQSASVQQQKNPFGFGAQTQTQQSNPFGFGVKGNNTSSSSKPFENKWSRFSANPGTTTAASQKQTAGQPPAAVTHSCTDPDTCKRQIAEDFQNERPLWKLTCYGHNKCAPCDIIGDVSFEEVRIAAYNDAKSGMSLPLIVEKERQLLNAKLVEFESLLCNPYKGPVNSITSQNPFPQATPNNFSPVTNNPASPSAWTFGQPASMPNFGSGINTAASPPITGFKQAGNFQNSGPSQSVFGTPNSPFGGLSGQYAQVNATPFGSNASSFSNSFMSAPSSTLSQFSNSMFSNATIQTGANTASLNTTDSFTNKPSPSDVSVDEQIWLKEKWHPGEIPETPPPERFVY